MILVYYDNGVWCTMIMVYIMVYMKHDAHVYMVVHYYNVCITLHEKHVIHNYLTRILRTSVIMDITTCLSM